MISDSLTSVLLSRQTTLNSLLYQGASVAIFEGKFQGYPAAVKIMYLNQQYDISQCEREFKNLQVLQHQNVLQIYDYVWHCENQTVCLILTSELCMKDVDREIKERKANKWFWTEAELWSFLKTLVNVLAYMQRQGIAHRDVKPSNIFLSFDGTIKLGDFGSSKYTSDGATTLAGTPFYLSPKLRAALIGGWQVADHDVFRSDVYSLGVVLLTMAKLEPPLNSVFSMNPEESFSCEITSLNYSDQLKGVLFGMLAWDETQRFDFLQLEQWLQGSEVQSSQQAYVAPESYPHPEAYVSPTFSPDTPEFAQPQSYEPSGAFEYPPVVSESLTVPSIPQSTEVLFMPGICAICKKPSDLKQSRQLFIATIEGQKFMCCSLECQNLMNTIKKLRKDFDCPHCHAKLPERLCQEIALFEKTNPDYDITEKCPSCSEEFEYEDLLSANSSK